MKKSQLHLSVIATCFILWAGIFTPSSDATERLSADLEQVTNVLSAYQQSINGSNFKLSAECLPPPMGQFTIANENMVQAFQGFAMAFEAKWGNELIEGVNLGPFKTHPLSYLSNYTFSNIQVHGDRATADIEMSVNGQVKKSTQHLAKMDGKWYIAQKEGPPGYSEADKQYVHALIGLLQEQLTFVKALTNKIDAGAISQEDCLAQLREKILAIEQRRVALTKS